MGAVYGVYLKYVALSALSGLVALSKWNSEETLAAVVAMYVCTLNAFVSLGFIQNKGMSVVGKDASTGKIPLWSYVLFIGFHIPTYFYTWLHTELGLRAGVPVATEVVKGWWLGGRYGNRLGKSQWAGTVDLTVEFPESCRDTSEGYLLIRCWDGVPPTPAQLEEAAVFCAEASKRGDVMVHCAHGRGRSTTVIVAALVRAGLFATWNEAFAACQVKRSVVKLNSKMRAALTAWDHTYNSKNK